jgi:hypothetical protein
MQLEDRVKILEIQQEQDKQELNRTSEELIILTNELKSTQELLKLLSLRTFSSPLPASKD